MGLVHRIVAFTLVLALALIGTPLPAHAAIGEEAPVQAAPAGAQTTPVQPVFSPYGTAQWEATGTSTPNKLTMAMSVSESDGLLQTPPQFRTLLYGRSQVARSPALSSSALIGAGIGFLVTTIVFASSDAPVNPIGPGLILGAPIGAAVGAVVGIIIKRR